MKKRFVIGLALAITVVLGVHLFLKSRNAFPIPNKSMALIGYTNSADGEKFAIFNITNYSSSRLGYSLLPPQTKVDGIWRNQSKANGTWMSSNFAGALPWGSFEPHEVKSILVEVVPGNKTWRFHINYFKELNGIEAKLDELNRKWFKRTQNHYTVQSPEISESD